jgi:rhodanese-related sulfurtransferase
LIRLPKETIMGLFDLFTRGGQPDADEISYEALVSTLEAKGCALIDVREPNEFSAGRVPGAVNMPLSAFDPNRLPKDKDVILICRSGARSANALSRARAAGRKDVRHYRGGVLGWQSRGGKLV